MKYIIILADGMAGRPLDELGNQTTLQYAHTPVMDELAGKGVIGTVKTVPDEMKPGSDVANLAVMGYDPAVFYSGRSPLEALSVGVNMEDSDVVFRCNLVTLSENDPQEPYEIKKIIDHSAGEISTEDADILMDAIREAFNSEDIQFHTGTSYRHITVWKNGQVLDMAAPHDHLGHPIAPYIQHHPLFRNMMEKSFNILTNHPLNLQRAKEGKNKANSLWFWGAGVRPRLQNFREKTGLNGGMISAVDLLKGIAVGTGMKVIEVPGANGSLETNYIGKAYAAVNALLRDDLDFVYIHVEAPDEMGHQGNPQNKIKAIENIDSKIVRIVKDQMDASGEDYRMLILPDHPTPICLRTHTSDPVPYILYDSRRQAKRVVRFNEQEAEAAGNYQPLGYKLLETLIEKDS